MTLVMSMTSSKNYYYDDILLIMYTSSNHNGLTVFANVNEQ